MIGDAQSAAMIPKVKEFLKLGRHSPEVTDAAMHATLMFDRNRQNRNQLSHYLVSGGKEGLELWRDKGTKLEQKVIPTTLEDIRRVAGELEVMKRYLAAMGNHLAALQLSSGAPPPLPNKPPLPEYLWKPEARRQ